MTPRFKSVLFQSAVCIGPLLVLLGLATTSIWAQVVPARAVELCVIAAITGIVALLVSKFTKQSASSALLFIATILLLCHIGLEAFVAAVAFAGAAVGLGSIFTSDLGSRRPAVALLVGTMLISGVVSWLLPFPVHTPIIYAIALGAIWVFRFRHIYESAARSMVAWKCAVRRTPLASFCFVLVLLLASSSLWIPTIQYDDMAHHIGLLYQLQEHSYNRMDVASHAWELTPWSSDVIQAIVGLLGGGEARGAVNAIWLLLTLYFLSDIGRTLGLPAQLRWLVMVAFLSQPLILPILGSMQTESAITAVTAGLISTLLHIKRQHNYHHALTPVILLCAALLALKATQILLVGPIVIWALWGRNLNIEAKNLVKALPFVALIMGSSYFYATLITRNPILPVFNNIFHSPYFPFARFDDPRWHDGVNFWSIWRITFHSSRFMEVTDGAAGFLPLGLIGGIALGFFDRKARAPLLCLGFAMLGTFASIQYLRYVFPFFSVCIPLAVVGYFNLFKDRRSIIIAISPLILINFIFYPASLYIYKEPVIWDTFRLKRSVSSIQEEFAPESVVASYFRIQNNPERSIILAGGEPYNAPFAGKAISPSPYDPTFSRTAADANQDSSGDLWRRVFDVTGVSYVLTSPDSTSAIKQALESMHAYPVFQVGRTITWKLPYDGSVRSALINQRDFAKRMLWPKWLISLKNND